MPADRPNIVLVMSDQHSRRVAGCYGSDLIDTPHMDRLAEQGVLFATAYCPFPLCGPSRMSFLTGRHPHRIGTWDNPSVLASDVPTFAHALGAGGYRAVLCGRMHFHGYDQRHGFAERIFPDCGGTGPALEGTNGFGLRSLQLSGPGRNPYLLYDEQCTDAAVAWLGGAGPHADGPFCLVVGWVGPHCPFVCPRDLFEKYFDRVDLPTFSYNDLNTYHQRTRLRSELGRVSQVDVRRTRAAYFGMVEFDDRQLGRVLEAIDAAGLTDDTLVIYTSDHGELAGEHGLWWKLSFYEGSAGVPLIVRMPGSGDRRRIEQPVSLIDLGPTLSALTGSPPLPEADGRSLAPLLNGGELPPADVFCELLATGRMATGPIGGPARMLRRGDWKFNYYRGDRCELFNLRDDPDERRDRSLDRACRGRLDQMQTAVLDGWDPRWIATDAWAQDERIRLIHRAPRDQSRWEADWEPPDNYGCVEEV